MDNDSLIRRLERVFKKICPKGISTMPFGEQPEDVKDYFLTSDILLSHEFPIIVMFQSCNNWLVVTTQRLMWNVRGEHHSLVKNDITYATLDLAANKKHGINWDYGCGVLTVFDQKNRQFDIEVEPGKALYGLINVICELVRLSRPRSP